MKNIILKVALGMVTTIAIMAIGFYFFLFLNPLHIYKVNLLKWIPMLIAAIAMLCSGMINKNTPMKFLPFLFLPFYVFDLFSFFYVPFVFFLILIGVLTLISTRNSIKNLYKLLSGLGTLCIFFYFLFSQSLIVMSGDSYFNDKGKLSNAFVLWDFNEHEELVLPEHIVFDQEDIEFDLKDVKNKTCLITFWATWCPPCMREKPELEKLKKELHKKPHIKFIDISFDDDIHKWKQFIENETPMGIQLISKNEKATRRLLQISAIPMHYIVNSDGVYKEYQSFEQAQKVLKKVSVEKQN